MITTLPFAALIDDDVLKEREAIEALCEGDYEKGFDLFRQCPFARGIVNFGQIDPDTRKLFRMHLDESRPIIVRGEQAIGDQLFFLRYAGAWKHNRHIYFALDPKLTDLLSYNGYKCVGIDEEIPGALLIHIGDLPYLQEIYTPLPPVELEGWPLQITQIRKLVFPDDTVKARIRLLTWRAGTDWNKEIPIPLFGGFLKGLCKPHDQLATITRFPKWKERETLEELSGHPITELCEWQEDMLLLANLFTISHQYIGVSSAAAHLFGAVNHGGKIMLFPHGGLSWYWRPKVDTWYPGTQLVEREDF